MKNICSIWKYLYFWGVFILAIDLLARTILNSEGIHLFLEDIGLSAVVLWDVFVLGLLIQTLRNLGVRIKNLLKRTPNIHSLKYKIFES